MGVRRVFLDIALGDWDENEASVSCGFCARCCKSCQHLPLRMSRNALGEYSEGQSTKSTAFQAVFWMVMWGHWHWAEMWRRSLWRATKPRDILHCFFLLFLLWSLYTGIPAMADARHFRSLIFSLWLWYPLHQTLSTCYTLSLKSTQFILQVTMLYRFLFWIHIFLKK